MGGKLTNSLLAKRYNVSVKTIGRWVKAGILDQPEKINGHHYHDEEKVEQRERDRMAKAAKEAA
jgi:predicted site-specific integrase-resolvase